LKEILLITNSFPTENYKRSGIFAYDDYLSFLDNGSKVNMIILYRITFEKRHLLNLYGQYKNNKSQINEINAAIADLPNIELITYFSMIKPFVFKEDLFLNKTSKFKNKNFTSIIVHSMLHTGLNISWIKKQFPNQKIILKEHSDWSLFNKITKYFCLKKINLYSEVLSNSLISKEKMENFFLSNKNIVVSPPEMNIDYPKFFVNEKPFLKTYSTLKFITIANLIKEKGFEETFEIMKIVNHMNLDWSWTIVGKGTFLNRIEELIVLNGFERNIKIIPELNKERLYEEFIKSNIYVQLSYRETFGIAPIEGFSFFNKLIVSNEIASVNELGLKKNLNILVLNDIDNIIEQQNDIVRFLLKNQDIDEFSKAISFIKKEINS
jgi:glycosyltransferase involved in cell wall biosynthesis